MSGFLMPGLSGEPLPAGETVVRMTKESGGKKADLNAFVSSTQDEVAPRRGVSVFAEALTTPQEAQAMLSHEYVFALRLPVDAVRKLCPPPEVAEVPSLDVVWDALTIAGVPDTRPGAIAHAGIVGLHRPASFPKLAYRSYRSQLADLAQATGIIALPPLKENL